MHNSSKAYIVERSVTLENLLKLLSDPSAVIQQNTIAVINALFLKADEARRKIIANTFSTKQYRSVIFECVLNSLLGTEMTHQLSMLLSLTSGSLEPRMNDRTVDQDAFEGEGAEHGSDTARSQNNSAQHYRSWDLSAT